jgi:hypothetical protein
VRNSKEGGQNITKTMLDPVLPVQIISSPPWITSTHVRVSAEEASGDLDLASSDLDEGGDPKHQGIEVNYVPMQTPVGQKGKTRCKYRSKRRSPAKFTGTATIVEGEGGNEGTREDKGQRVEAYSKDDDFQSTSPLNKSAAGVKLRLKADAAKPAPTAPILEAKKMKKMTVDQRNSTAANTRAAKRGSKG